MDLTDILKENFSSVIGVLGTLIGVLLGFILNNFSKYGRLKIFQNETKYTLSEKDGFGGSKPMDQITSDTNYLGIFINLEFYNNSENRKMIRNVHFITKTKKKKFKNLFSDASTRKISGGKIHIDSFQLLNINPKEIIQKSLQISFFQNFEEILNSDWYFTYNDHHQNTKKFKINKDQLEKSQ